MSDPTEEQSPNANTDAATTAEANERASEPAEAPEGPDEGAQQPSTMTPDAVRAEIAWLRENPAHEEALRRLIELRDNISRPEFSADALAAAKSVLEAVMTLPEVGPVAQAHVMILMSLLLDVNDRRDDAEKLFLAWLRYPGSFGPARATPPAFQRPEFVQRVADLLGWGSLDVKNDRDALVRFAAWVNSWAPRKKFKARRTVDLLRRAFHAPDVWKVISFDAPGGGGGGHHGHGHGHGRRGDRGERGERGNARGGPREGNAASPAQVENPGNETAPGNESAPGNEKPAEAAESPGNEKV